VIALAGSVFLASLVGSTHCAGMCGGIAAFCAGAGESTGRRSMAATAAYHAARGASYAAVGAAAGAFGRLLDAGGAVVGLQRGAAVAAGVAVALVGVALLSSAGGLDAGRVALPAWLRDALAVIHRAAAAMSPVRRAISIGFATPLLPCGWLWAFALVAAGTGSVAWGAAVMLAFWAGTVPLLALLGVGIASLGGARRQLLTALAGLAMVAVGVHTAAMRASLAVPVAERLAHESSEVPAAHASIEHPARPACCAAEAGQ
jgi:sulfite exporter TauE/SafE